MDSQAIRNVVRMDGSTIDLVVQNGVITAAGPDAARDFTGGEIIDVQGKLLFPGLIDAHTHMEKTLIGLGWHRNEVGPTLIAMIENERRVRREEQIDFHAQSLLHARHAIATGTTHIRTHVDIDTESKLKTLHGVQRTREDLAKALDIQIVAFPQSGMLIRPGTVELLEAALSEGADLIGGLDPCSMDRDPAGHLDTIFGLAGKYDVDVDIHLHEPGELGAFSIELIAERTRVLGYRGRVTISHAFALGSVDPMRRDGLVELLLENDIAIMSHGPGGHRMVPDIKYLRSRGVRLCAGNDGVQDTWSPLQRPDMLERAYIMAYRNNLRRDDDIEDVIDIVTYGNAQVMGVEGYGLEPGSPADFVLVDGETHVEAVVTRRPRDLVMKRGNIVARNGECLV